MNRIKTLYSLVLKMYPRHFQKTFAEQMMQTLVDSYSEAVASSGRAGMQFWLFILADEIRNIVGQHALAFGERYPFLRFSTVKLVVALTISAPLYVLTYGALVTVSLAVPHPSVSGVGFLLVMAALLLGSGVVSALMGYCLASLAVAAFPKRKASL